MRPYGQKRVYGKGLTRTTRKAGTSKIKITTGVKNHKRERAVIKQTIWNSCYSMS